MPGCGSWLVGLFTLSVQFQLAVTGPMNYTFLGRHPLDGPPGGIVEMQRPSGTDPSQVTYCQIDRHDPNVGWPGYSRPNGSKHTSDAIFMPASALASGRVACHMTQSDFPMITSGNATLSVLPTGCTKQSCTHVPTPTCCTATAGYVELFALFEVQFGRRPYLYETNGSIVILTDASLANVKLRLTATLPGGVEIDALVPGGCKWRVPFEMAQIPAKVTDVINISLTVGEGVGQHTITKRRRFARHPPPPQNSTVTAFQLDHERGGALRASGAEFLAQGWFNGGYNHHVDGLGTKFFAQHFGVREPNWFERQSLNLGSIAQHWGARGLNFVRFQSQVFADWSVHIDAQERQQQLAAFKLYLDECAMAGVYVLLDSGIDPLAIAGFNGTNGSAWTELLLSAQYASTITEFILELIDPNNNLHDTLCPNSLQVGNLSLVNTHPAFGGYYGCDDCCHMGSNINEHEYRGIETIREAIYAIDPYHLFIGSSTCGNIWMWQEGLELNPGFGISDVGLDVVMREHYSGAIPNWNAPHWTQPIPFEGKKTRELDQRYYPMQLAALWDMPESPDGFTNDAGNKYKAFMYANLIVEGKASVNVFAFDDTSADSWERSSALYQFAAEARELQASILSAFPFFEEDATARTSTVSSSAAYFQVSATAKQQLSVKPTVETTTTPPCTKFAGTSSNTRKPWQGPVNCGVYARAFREATPFFCLHVVAVNPNAYPAMAMFEVSGMAEAIAAGADGPLAGNCQYMGNPGQPAPARCAVRLFDQQYAVNITVPVDDELPVQSPSIAGARVAATDKVAFHDMIGGSSAAVYRIGCTIPPLSLPKGEGPNLVFDGDFEGVDLAVPSKWSQQPGFAKPGHSLYPKVGGADSWQILHGEPPLPPQLGVQRDDLRAQIRPDTARPWHGRHALRLMMPSANSHTILPIPLLAGSYGNENKELKRWTLRLRLRASPAIANLDIVSGGCYIGGGVKNASGWFGAYYVPCPNASKLAKVGEVWGQTTAQVGPDWGEYELSIKNATMWSHNLWLNFSTRARLGTRVWLDGVTLSMHNYSVPARRLAP